MKLPLLVVCLLFAGSAFGQVSLGVKAGVPVTQFFETGTVPTAQYFTDAHRYTFGPTLEVHFPKGVAVEVDALYKRLSYGATSPSGESSSGTANSWEFPLLLKYRFESRGVVRPFLDAGVSFHSISGFKQLGNIITPSQLVHDFNGGVVLGGGLDFHILLHIEPELRYTRWFTENFQGPSGTVRSKQDQVEFLVGFTF